MQPVRPPAQPGQPGTNMPMGMPLPFPLIQNINTLSELSGIPVHVLSNPGMQLAAQQLVAQRLMQQQLLSGQLRPAQLLPAQMIALQQQQQQMQQRAAAAGTTAASAAAAAGGGKKGAAGGKKKGRPAATPAAAPPQAAFAAAAAPRTINPLADPGGKVVWAKVGSYPWWPAKTLDPARDLSFPPDADPPRPTSIPIRFFGTFEFQWIGSKRQLTDWEEGYEQFSGECDQASFKKAMAEAQAYKSTGKLPDVFYVTPEPEKPKAKARGKKRARTTSDAGDLGLAGAGLVAAQAVAVAAPKARAAGRTAEAVEDRGPLVQHRKKQRLQDLGLLPPHNSPYTRGKVAPNPNLLQMKAEWEQEYAAVIEDHKEQQEDVAARRAAAAAAKERAAVAAKQAAAAAAAVAAAPPPGSMLTAALHTMPVQVQQQQQPAMMPMAGFMQQLMSMQAVGAASMPGMRQ